MLDAALAGGDVAHLAVRDDRAQTSPFDRLAAEHDRSARKVTSREDGSRRRVNVAHEKREILRARLETAVAARAAEASRKDWAIVELHDLGGAVVVGTVRADVR